MSDWSRGWMERSFLDVDESLFGFDWIGLLVMMTNYVSDVVFWVGYGSLL
jgi:hypothetical protein